MNKSIKTKGIHHLGLTVPNVDETTRFFVDVLGYEPLGERADYPAAFVSDGTTMITLWQTVDADSATPFDRRNVIGLHHLALAVDDYQALETVYERLRVTENVHIEFPPQARGNKGARHLMCNIPGGVRVEFLSPAP